jgi:DNA repair protein RadC
MTKTETKVAEISVSYKPSKAHKPIIKSSDDAYFHLLKFFPEETISLQESFVVLYTNRANRIIGVYEMSRGGISGTVADPKLILGVALKSAATGIILAHNHPSGNLQPSIKDKEITLKIQEACKLLDIILLDHLILVPQETFFSFADEGLLM